MARSAARGVALTALRQWRTSGQFADKIMQDLRQSRPSPACEKAFAQELFYGVIRNLTLLDFLISRLRKRPLNDSLRDLVRLGLYQLLCLRTPPHAAVFETVSFAPASMRPVVNGVLRNAVRQAKDLKKQARRAPLHVRESHPEFLIERWRKAYGSAATVALCQSNNEAAPIYARVNTLRTTPESLVKEEALMQPVPRYPLFARCETLPSSALVRGDCYIQDPSTALALDLLDPKPGERILDACAAPGGKTFQIAAISHNQAELVGCDCDPKRIAQLRENVHRLGIRARIVQHDWLYPSPDRQFAAQSFDKILVDAPCTNSGVMRRRVDVRWRLTPGDFLRMSKRQLGILRAVLPLLRPGGVIVYSTCSIEGEENCDLIRRLCEESPALRLGEMELRLPFQQGFDGAFAARLEFAM